MKFSLCKKQYVYLALAALSLALAITTHVFAQEVAPATYGSLEAPPNGAPVSPTVNTREERRAALEERIQDRIINLARNVIGRLGAAATRMDNIIHRLDARIALLKERGVDTRAAEESLQTSKNSLARAQSTLSTLDGSVVDGITSDKPRQAFKELRAEFLVVREAIRDTHSNLIRTVDALKVAVKAAETGTGASDAVQNTGSLVEPAPGTEVPPANEE